MENESDYSDQSEGSEDLSEESLDYVSRKETRILKCVRALVAYANANSLSFFVHEMDFSRSFMKAVN